MRNTEAALYARWSAAIALLLAVVVVCVYSMRAWQNHLAKGIAPASVPASVQQQSSGFSFSKQTGNRTEFTVRASHATQFAKTGRDVLQDVWITVYGRMGDRFDNIHTRSCELIESTGNISCGDEVDIDLQSAADAAAHPASVPRPNPQAQIVHVQTSQITFDRTSGVATSDQRVSFVFADGAGRAMGFRYQADGTLQLMHQVELTLHPQSPRRNDSPAPESALSNELDVTCETLTFRRDELVIHLLSTVNARQGTWELAAGKADVELNAQMRMRRIIASDQPQLHSMDPTGMTAITAAQFVASVSAAGWVEKLIAVGGVHAQTVRLGPSRGEDRLDAAKVEIEFAPGANEPRSLTATQNVVAESKSAQGATQHMATSRLDLTFVPAPQAASSHVSAVTAASPHNPQPGTAHGVQLARAVSPETALDWRDSAADAAKMQQLHLSSQHLDATFAAENELQEVHGTGGVQIVRQTGTAPPQVSTSRDVKAYFGADNMWTTVDQTGDVHLRENDRSAQADRAHFVRVADTATLVGSVALLDANTRTTAESAVLRHAVNEMTAEGRVASSDLSASSGQVINLGAGAAHVSGDHLFANTVTGHATYTGGARLWQGNSLVQAETIELDRTTQVVTATNHVKAVFEQVQSAAEPIKKKAAGTGGNPASTKLWHAESAKMVYTSKEGRARLEQDVHARSDDGTIRADAMDLFFAPNPTPPAISFAAPPKGTSGSMPVNASAGAPGGTRTRATPTGTASTRATSTAASGSGTGIAPGGQQLVRAVATGSVAITQEDHRGTATRGEYTAFDGKLVLSGGPPRVYDNSGNSTSGRQLTLFLADDTILIDSAEGVRTLTMHPVEK